MLLFFPTAVLASVAFAVLGAAGSAHAATPQQVQQRAIAWLEAAQNPDGSWGEDPRRVLVTAEVLNALTWAGRSETRVAQRGVGWLRNQEIPTLDYRARALREHRREKPRFRQVR